MCVTRAVPRDVVRPDGRPATPCVVRLYTRDCRWVLLNLCAACAKTAATDEGSTEYAGPLGQGRAYQGHARSSAGAWQRQALLQECYHRVKTGEHSLLALKPWPNILGQVLTPA